MKILFYKTETEIKIFFFTFRSKVKLTTRELKLALKQGTILLENFYPTRVLKRLIVPLVESETSPTDSSYSERGKDSGSTLTRKSIVAKVLQSTTSKRISVYKDFKFNSEDAWWDSKGLTVGKNFYFYIIRCYVK